ncbi:MAG: DegV family protein [Psychrobacter sp.]|nr:DegV family protein [Psychrobacter sp.]
MSRIVISTSSSGLDNISISNTIDIIRLRMFINNVEFVDGKNITSERLRMLMTELDCSAVHTTPAPATEITELFTNLYHHGYKEVFITTLSSKLSESYKIIKEVANRFTDRMDIYVYDCKELNICEATLALEAEHLMSEGKSLGQIAQRLDDLRRSHKMLFAIDDLSYLIKNKKLSTTAGFFANMFSIKPVLKMTDEGEIVAVNKIRKIDRALEHIVDEFAAALQHSDTFGYVFSMGRPELDKQFMALIQQRTGIKSLPILPVSNISLANHGPTGVGLGVFIGELPFAAAQFKSL